jgi:hypothetical protein
MRFFRSLALRQRRPSLAPSPRPIELGVKPGADGFAAQRHKVIVLTRLAGPAEIGRAGALEAVIDAIALQAHQFATQRI